jgi:hypothetical protein
MKSKLIIFLLLLSFSACNCEDKDRTALIETKSSTEEGYNILDRSSTISKSFDKEKWALKEGKDYPYRDQMLDAVVYTDTIRKLRKDKIVNLLGEPSYYSDDEYFLYYTIKQRRLGPWPFHTKTMVIKLKDNNSVDWIKIHE